MELEIQDKLEEIYKNVLIRVEFDSFRRYKIYYCLDYLTSKILEGEIIYIWDSSATNTYNINSICNIIDSKLLKLLKRGD